MPELCDEIADICASLHWPCRPFDTTFDVEAQYVPGEPGDGPVKEVRLRGASFSTRNFARLTHYINVVDDALENYNGPMPEDGSPQSLADLIEKILREKLGGEG